MDRMGNTDIIFIDNIIEREREREREIKKERVLI